MPPLSVVNLPLHPLVPVSPNTHEREEDVGVAHLRSAD